MAKLILSRKGQPDSTFFLTGTEWLLGSNPACPVRINTPAILPTHARITRNDGKFRIAALADGMEIRVNHGHAPEHVLRDGDVIHLGDYALVFSTDSTAAAVPPTRRPQHAWLQVLNGTHRGRNIRLAHPVTRFGSAGDLTVMISRRSDGYYLSHLEGDEFPQVNHTVINDTTWPLNEGDTIRMGKLSFGFHAGCEPVAEAGEPANGGQRHFTRVSLHNSAIIATDNARWNTRLVDLSLSGALLEHPAGWVGSNGDRFRLELQLADRSFLELNAQVRQIDADRLGMAFIDLHETDRDEIRWLVDINLGDATLLQRELSEFV